MSTEELELELAKGKRERAQLRRLFTICANKVIAAFEEESLDQLKVLYPQLLEKGARLFRVEDSVSELLFNSEEDEGIIKEEYDTRESYRDTYSELATRWEELTKKTNIDDLSSVGYACRKQNKPLKLPKIVPVEFDGQLKNWISFWAIFKRIHDSDEYDDGEKFQYLLMYTKKGSPARELVESFPPSPENYQKAVDWLKTRFGRDDLLIELYVRELLALVLLRARGEGSLPLRKLYDQLETQIRGLASLGVASDKYTYLLTPLIESALPDQVLGDWERVSRASIGLGEGVEIKLSQLAIQDSPTKNDKLTSLLDFLRREVETEECLKLKRSSFVDTNEKIMVKKSSPSSTSPRGLSNDNSQSGRTRTQTAAGLVNTERNFVCIFCSSSKHSSEDCVTVREKPKEELIAILRKKGHCFRCFRRGHSKVTCKVFVKCIICNLGHFALLCPERKCEVKSDDVKSVQKDFKTEANLHNACRSQVLMQTLQVRIKGVPKLTARALFDTGSQRSYVTKSLVEKMKGVPTGEIELEHALFGGVISRPKTHKCYKIRLEAIDKEYACNFDVLDTDSICVSVPSIPAGRIIEDLKRDKIPLIDSDGGSIDVLIGADVAGKLMTGQKRELDNGLTAIQTHLGWTLMGKIPQADSSFMSHINLFTADIPVHDLWRLETIGIEDSAQVKTREEKAVAAKQHFLENVKILESGRYEVKLPWSSDHPTLPRNFNLALKRTESTIRKLKATANVAKYFDVFQSWLNAGIIEEVPLETSGVGHYLPHRPVYKEGSTTPIRPVFDASSKENGRPSLNQCLEVGPNLVELIPSVLLRFREKRIGLIADIKGAFLQISLHPIDRDFLRFIWIDDGGQMRIFRHTRVVFGVCSSPFLLGAVIELHLNRYKGLIDEEEESTTNNIIAKLHECMYVDNFVGSLNNEEDIPGFIDKASSIFSSACFELRGWTHSNRKLPNHTNTPVLGMIWDEKVDTLSINVPTFRDIDENKVTKKDLMSANHRLFDPIGFTSPITVITKKLIQDAWIAGGKWDTPIDEKSSKIFLQWMKDVEVLRDIKVPRWISGSMWEGAVHTLHTFCDASMIAYAAVVFLRTEEQNRVNVQLVAAKTRVAPVQKVTIPRLELLAATVGARLAHHVLQVLPDVKSTYYWSDSTTTLAWIKQEEPWAVFVRNRVQEIRKLSLPKNWHHVPGESNPADLASRGCSPRVLVDSKWWEGPKWLNLPEVKWPCSNVLPDDTEVMKERLKTALVTCEVRYSSQILTKRMSQYWKIVKVIGWIVRFKRNASKNSIKTRGHLTLLEIDTAEKWLIRLVQKETFGEEGMLVIKKLKPQRTPDGLWRVRTKIWARNDSEDFRAPIILPSSHSIVEKLIFHTHCTNGHIVGQHLLNVLRERFWLVKGRSTVRRVINVCKVCQRYTAENLQTESPTLPEDRVRDANVFEVTGVDYAGPLYLSDGSKVWVCLFTCAIYRAIHLELVTSLSTECFILAFRRFVARRGRPVTMYSDNGTNFRGTKNALDAVDWDQIVNHGNVNQIEWKFNPPSAPWWGGFWERMVRTLKNLLRKNIGRASLNLEELNTILCDCESWINSRPITYVAENTTEPTPITPQMFLQEIREIGVPDCDQIDSKSMSRRLKHRQAVQRELRQRFRAEYLGQLTLTSVFGNTRAPRIGEVVLIGSDNSKRIDWPLGVIEHTTRGRDGKVRVVQVRTAEGKLVRPIQRIFPLELSCAGEDSEEEIPAEMEPPSEEEFEITTGQIQDHEPDRQKEDLTRKKIKEKTCNAQTRCGRKVKLPLRFQ